MSRCVIYITRVLWENVDSCSAFNDFITNSGAEFYDGMYTVPEVCVESYVVEGNIIGHNTVEDILQKKLTSRLVLEMWDEWENHMDHRIVVFEKGKLPQSMHEYIDDVDVVPEVSPEHLSKEVASDFVRKVIDVVDLTVFKWAEHDWSV